MKKMLLLTIFMVCGCSDNIGPFIREVKYAPNGDLKVTTCDVVLRRGFGTSLFAQDCVSKTVHQHSNSETQ